RAVSRVCLGRYVRAARTDGPGCGDLAAEGLLVEPGEPRERAKVQLAGERIGLVREDRESLGEEPTAPVGALEPALEALRDHVDHELEQRLRRGDEPSERRGILAREVVRVG